MDEMTLLCRLFVLLFVGVVVHAWSGNYYHQRNDVYYVSRRVCRARFIWCWSHRTVWNPRYTPVYACCPGWTHSGNRNCNRPVCSPSCKNGGTCRAASPSDCIKRTGYCLCNPNKCDCRYGYTGLDCAGKICSHLAPCYPGTCIGTDGCQCANGFSSSDSQKLNYCRQINYNADVNLKIYKMQVRMSQWPRGKNPPEEKYFMMTDSTRLSEDNMDFVWTNQRDFNRIETTCSSQFFTKDLPGKPIYIGKTTMGVVSAKIDIMLSKRPVTPGRPRFYSLNGTINCPLPVSHENPEPGLYECDIINRNFDRLLEHGDFLKVTYKTRGGGFRELVDLNRRGRPIQNQTFEGPERTLSVEFKFDFEPPHHCVEKSTCSSGEAMLNVPDITKTSPLTITWSGWTDDDSGMYRYAWQVFKMTKTADGGVEVRPNETIHPIVTTEVLHSNLQLQDYTPPDPGMYTFILEAADVANNTKYVRRLCLYDPTSDITFDPDHALYVTTASKAANYTYQNNASKSITVTWSKHFRNAFHEDNNLLGYVRPFLVPPLQDGVKRSIPNNTQEDHKGERTIQAITNARGILKFEVSYAQDSGGGLEQPEVPSSPQVPWKQMDLQTTYTVPVTPRDGDTVTTWVKATDAMGNVKVDRTKVTFDSTPPRVNRPVFVMNAMVPGVDFSSTFEMTVRDDHSGVAYTDWTFTRKNGSVVYEERFYGRKATKAECEDNLTGCHCTSAGDCFWFDQSYSLSNCRMMVEKENLDNEVITVTADVTNMAGLVTRETLTITNLTVLNGTEAYFPPQNIKVTSITDGGVTLTWDFPPSCFSRTDVWVIVNGEKRAVHKDAEQFDLTGLDSDTTYTIYLQTRYDGGEMSDRQPLTFTTAESPTSAGLVAGVTISVFVIVLLILFVTVFVLYRRGMILQQPGRIHNQLHRVSTVYDHAKRVTRQSLRRPGHGLMNHAFDPENDEIYQYGEMTFQTRQGWQLDDSSLTLIDHVAEGKFANIYRATWQHDGRKDIVAAKMPKPGFSEDDALKMMAKINFFATAFDDHDNVIRFLGAVTDNTSWGPVLVMEFCDNGQMDKWLAAHRDQVGEQTTEDLMQFSLGVAKGMEYLASKGITHRRLAARNILLTSHLDVRVAGFGPQHKEGSEDKATKVPAKWAAPEVLADKPPTEKSDVWSYGVVLWEIFSMGQVPYPTMHSTEIGARIKGGYRMEKPEMADNLHYDLMKECWQYKPTKRPTFKTIRARLEQQFSPGNRQSVDFYYETNQLNPGPSSE